MASKDGALTGEIDVVAYGDGKYHATKAWADANGGAVQVEFSVPIAWKRPVSTLEPIKVRNRFQAFAFKIQLAPLHDGVDLMQCYFYTDSMARGTRSGFVRYLYHAGTPITTGIIFSYSQPLMWRGWSSLASWMDW
jgi:hypothetical protein